MTGTRAVPRTGLGAAAVLLLGVAVAVSVGVYARVHQPAARPLFLVGFSGMLQMKAWLATAALVLVLLQLLSALWMWGRLPGVHGSTPGWIAPAHRWSGTAAFVVSLPVALHCVWSLGFVTTTPRVLLHSTMGCAFYGGYAAKMLGLRLPGPRWLLPVAGGTVFTTFVLAWLSSALWFFTRSGVPLI